MLTTFTAFFHTVVKAEEIKVDLEDTSTDILAPQKDVANTVRAEQANACLKKGDKCQADIERIEVIGNPITPISTSAEGVYILDKQMLKEYLFGNGNLNDVLGVLPGVQFSESAYAASQVTNIKPNEVSISGANGNQSGYQIDGVSNNSKLNNSNSQIDSNSSQDVAGHSQEVFLNLKILEELEVYDSNIPAKYGQFSGGLVLAKTQEASQKTHFGFSYRQTADQFVEYHKFYAPDFDGGDTLDTATFKKKDFNAYLTLPINDKSGLVAQVQLLQSRETLNQLGELRFQKQDNYNGLLKYHYKLSDEDKLVFRYLIAPYEGNYFELNAINSDYDIDGGGQSFLMQWQADRQWGYIDTQLDWRSSKNNKTTASSWYVWANAPGKAWGDYNSSTTSLAGGYGDIEKTQDTFSFKQDIELYDVWQVFGQHSLSLGYQLEYQQSVFNRLEDSVDYNGSVISPEVNCNGYTTDCIETSFKRPIEDIERELGRALDLSNADDFALYQENLESTGQYFQSRQVTPKAKAEANIVYASAYIEDDFTVADLNLSVGLRYDYNNFFKNHNLAPRIRASYEFDGGYQIVLGANRYYQSDSADYKLNQAKAPVHNEVRSSLNNRPLQWQAALLNTGYRYEYRGTDTPFSDELTAAYRQPLLGGMVELKWINRKNKDGINRIKGYNSAGESILYAGNDGYSEYRRWSLSWMANYANQHVEFNISHASNTTSRSSFDGDTTIEGSESTSLTDTLNYSYNDSELVFLRTDEPNENGVITARHNLVTRNDINLERQDANRPIVANLSWAGRWDSWQFSAYARFNGKQDAIYPTGETQSIKDAITICTGCVAANKEYPVYRLAERPSFWLLSGSIRYNWLLSDDSSITLSFDGENLLNKRTYQVSPFTTGLELGRTFWLGISYDH